MLYDARGRPLAPQGRSCARRPGVGALRRAVRGVGGAAPGGPPLGLVIAGQSNVGQGNLGEVPGDHDRNQSQIVMLDTDDATLVPASEPTHVEKVGTIPGAGFAVALANRLIEEHGWRRGIRIAARSWAGSALHFNWRDGSTPPDPGNDAMTRFIARAQATLTDDMPALGIWYQGETETVNGTLVSLWPGRCTSMLSYIRTQLGRPTMPWIVVILPPTIPDPPEDRPFWPDQRTGQATLDNTDSGWTRTYQAPDGPFDDSIELHLATSAQITLGHGLADAAVSYGFVSV
jgi:hypothetical protein